MLTGPGLLRVVSFPKIGANDIAALALGTVQGEAEVFVLALMPAFATEESGVVVHERGSNSCPLMFLSEAVLEGVSLDKCLIRCPVLGRAFFNE
jgi:hypothetical protein